MIMINDLLIEKLGLLPIVTFYIEIKHELTYNHRHNYNEKI